MKLFSKCQTLLKIKNGNKMNFNYKNFATLIIPDIVGNSKLHNTIHNLSTAASKLGDKDVIINF